MLNFCGFWFFGTFSPFKEARFCDLIICTIEAAISRVRGECKRREGEKTENEILLFFNLKSRFGKEQAGKRVLGVPKYERECGGQPARFFYFKQPRSLSSTTLSLSRYQGLSTAPSTASKSAKRFSSSSSLSSSSSSMARKLKRGFPSKKKCS